MNSEHMQECIHLDKKGYRIFCFNSGELRKYKLYAKIKRLSISK